MIEISYNNVMNGLNKGFNMSLLSPTQEINAYVFNRAVDLWYVAGFSSVSKRDKKIKYGLDGLLLSFDVFESLFNQEWRAFKGIFLIHPNLKVEEMVPRFASFYNDLDHHNMRYLNNGSIE